MPEATIRTAVDTYATSSSPSTTFSGSRKLGTLTGSTYAYVYFTRPMPLKAVVTSAKLRLYLFSATTVPTTISAIRIATSLQASRLTWNGRPATVGSSSPAATVPIGPAGTMVEIDVKDIMQLVADGAPWYGLRLGSGVLRWWGSAEGAAGLRPQLYVKWSEQPRQPTSLSPDGNDAVSAAKPILRFQVTDVLGDTTIGAVNVQTAATPDFAAPFDSGWYVTGDNQLDLSQLTAPVFPALSEGQSIYWRVRVRDGAGLVSAWSHDAQLRRVSWKTLTIDNPGAVTRTNVLPNPSFEVDTSNWSVGGAGVTTRVTTSHYSGTAACSFTGPAGASMFAPAAIYTTSVTPGDSWTASAYVKGTAGETARIGINFYNGTTAVQTTFTTFTLTGAWDRIYFTSPVPATANGLRHILRIQAGVYLVDAAMLERSADVNSYIEGTVSGLPGFVTEPTPPIMWTYSGTQERWQVFIYDPAKGHRAIVNSGVRTSTETAWTVPPKILKGKGPYVVTVRIWDNVDRDPADQYIDAVQEFTVTHDPTVAPVTDMSIDQPDPWPSVRLLWSRATAPDWWIVERDGVVIEDSLDPEDASLGGTEYYFEDDWSRAWKSHTWKVRARVNGKMSDSGTLTRTPTLRGVWVMDRRRGIYVFLAGQDGGTWTEPEDATALAPLGGTKVVRRIQGVRNYEGSLTGQLVDAFGRTMAAYEADLRRIRDEPNDVITLAAADFSLKVLIGNVQFAPTSNHVPPSRLVSFDFWEV